MGFLAASPGISEDSLIAGTGWFWNLPNRLQGWQQPAKVWRSLITTPAPNCLQFNQMLAGDLGGRAMENFMETALVRMGTPLYQVSTLANSPFWVFYLVTSSIVAGLASLLLNLRGFNQIHTSLVL
jgi:hypothetical protein